MKEKDTRFENAAMEFSLKTLQPTYCIIWGSTGESNALCIAKSIGFDEDIIRRANTWVERLMPEKMQKQKGLLYQSLMEERSRLETQAIRAASLYSDIMYLYNEALRGFLLPASLLKKILCCLAYMFTTTKIRYEAEDLAVREEILKIKETQQIQLELKAAKSQIENIIEKFDNRLRIASADQFNSLLKESESAVASIVEAHCHADDFSAGARDAGSYRPRLGEKVFVKGLGNKLATVVETADDDDTVLVQYGKMIVRVNISSTRALPTSDKNSAITSAPRMRRLGQRRKNLRNFGEASNTEGVSYGPVLQTSRNTLDLRGMRVEEASRHLKMTIGATESNSVIFIIHGMGTGVVKECTLETLRNHPRVSKFEQESPLNYGCTVAYIK